MLEKITLLPDNWFWERKALEKVLGEIATVEESINSKRLGELKELLSSMLKGKVSVDRILEEKDKANWLIRMVNKDLEGIVKKEAVKKSFLARLASNRPARYALGVATALTLGLYSAKDAGAADGVYRINNLDGTQTEIHKKGHNAYTPSGKFIGTITDSGKINPVPGQPNQADPDTIKNIDTNTGLRQVTPFEPQYKEEQPSKVSTAKDAEYYISLAKQQYKTDKSAAIQTLEEATKRIEAGTLKPNKEQASFLYKALADHHYNYKEFNASLTYYKKAIIYEPSSKSLKATIKFLEKKK